MKNKILVSVAVSVAFMLMTATSVMAYDKNPPFKLDKLKKFVKLEGNGQKTMGYEPVNNYNVFVNYELGMHCVGFSMDYCCIIPPYNSIQAQAIKSGANGLLPKLLSPDNGVKLYYYTRDNTYSEGNKMRYFAVPKDADGDGHFDSANDTVANYVWTHLFIYKDLEGTMPKGATDKDRLRLGRQIPMKIDSGPSGMPISGGYLEYAGKNGGNIVFVDTLVPAVKNVRLILTSSYIWDALGLPLTAFNDSTRKGTIRSVEETDFQPFQYSTVEMHTRDGRSMHTKDGRTISYFGTNPVDIPNCYACHSRNGKAADMARDEGLMTSDEEYSYWKSYPDESEYMARLAEASINILSLHDAHHGTEFLKDYKPNAIGNRLGKVGLVNCTDCHGDNVSGNLLTPRIGAAGYKAVHAKPLSEAIHGFHLAMVPMPDGANRTQACQSCHPTHFQNPNMNDDSNPFRVTDRYGEGRFSKGDIRKSGGGCYVRRDAHSNPNAKPPFFLNEYGKWQYKNVATKDEHGKKSELRGLYCTNCHTKVAQDFQNYDDIKHDSTQKGKTLRNKSLKEMIKVLYGGSTKKFTSIADPKTTGENEVLSYYADHKSAILVKNIGKNGKIDLKPWNHPKGGNVPYVAASGGNDWWLAAAEPHCADCHIAPFVESETGGKYFPIDLPNKYSLYRYSKAHGNIACQSCHESAHGLYSSRFDGQERSVDVTTHEQALQYSPDGEYAGPVTCATCHTVNKKGVPLQLKNTKYKGDYWASVTLAHFMRGGDQKLSIKELTTKYPYKKSAHIVTKGWK